jgi:hypothetical protein
MWRKALTHGSESVIIRSMTPAVNPRARDAQKPTTVVRDTDSAHTSLREGDRIAVNSGGREMMDVVTRVIGSHQGLWLVETRQLGEVVVLFGKEGAPRVVGSA